MADLNRLICPRSIAVVGGGAWCEQVIRQTELMGFDGAIWPVHHKVAMVAGYGAFPSVQDLPEPPDAVFVGVNRHASVDIVEQLAQLGAGGAVCFASGFAEAAGEDASGSDLQARLVAAAGDMPILGPNCYGFINALDGALLWPDQHGCKRVDRGVAILTQSSNIAINLTMQQRALPIAYTVTCGNMAQTSQASIAQALLDDPRVTAIGLHIEGFGDLRAWEALARTAYDRGVPLVALKSGASDHAKSAAISHTASLAGSDAGAQALLRRLGIARVSGLPEFIETLKLLHCTGPLSGQQVASISCSGGEASLIADLAEETTLNFPPLTSAQTDQLRAALGPMVALSNPLDYHTYIWRDAQAMTAAWAGMTGAGIDMTFSIVDYPTTDPTDWDCATQAALSVRQQTHAPFAVVATLPELMPLDVAAKLMEGGVVPFMGLREALAATVAASATQAPHDMPLCLGACPEALVTLTEADAKAQLAQFGMPVPEHRVCTPATITALTQGMTPPFAVKGIGFAHKSEHQAVRLGVPFADLEGVAKDIGSDTVLVEEMVTDAVAELLVGVTRDPAHGFVLTLGAGGILTEVLQDTVSLLLPVTDTEIKTALGTLACAPLLAGYRGKPAAHLPAIVDAVLALQSYVLAHVDSVSEAEINPLICTPNRAIAVDALIRKA